MNIFRLLGDFCHLYSILVLIYKIHVRKTTAGISLRTCVLYLFVFLARYGDLFLYYINFYNTFMKILYLSATTYIIYLMTINPDFKNTWYHDLDNMSILPLLVGSSVLGLICTSQYSIFEIMWTFSIVLESVAILPQIDHLTKVPALPALPLSHLVALGLYRFFYVLNWVFRIGADGIWDLTAFFFGIVQTIIWADFLWVWYNRKQIKLPPDVSAQTLRGQEEGMAGEGQQVDAGDMSKSLVLTHIITFVKLVEERILGGRLRPGLSVSAYPDQSLAGQAAEAYTDVQAQREEEYNFVPDVSPQQRPIASAATPSDEGTRQLNHGADNGSFPTTKGSTNHEEHREQVEADTVEIPDDDDYSVQSDAIPASLPKPAA